MSLKGPQPVILTLDVASVCLESLEISVTSAWTDGCSFLTKDALVHIDSSLISSTYGFFFP